MQDIAVWLSLKQAGKGGVNQSLGDKSRALAASRDGTDTSSARRCNWPSIQWLCESDREGGH
jgi:hypothetical protein